MQPKAYTIKVNGKYILENGRVKHFTAEEVKAFLEEYKRTINAVRYYQKYKFNKDTLGNVYVYVLPDGTRKIVVVTPIYPAKIVRVVRKPRKEQMVRKPIPKENAIIKIPEIELPEKSKPRKIPTHSPENLNTITPDRDKKEAIKITSEDKKGAVTEFRETDNSKINLTSEASTTQKGINKTKLLLVGGVLATVLYLLLR